MIVTLAGGPRFQLSEPLKYKQTCFRFLLAGISSLSSQPLVGQEAS